MIDINTTKFIELEYVTDASVSNMMNEIKTSKIFEILNTDVRITDPIRSYDFFIKTILQLKNNFILKKRLNYIRKKHKKNECITTAIHSQINKYKN